MSKAALLQIYYIWKARRKQEECGAMDGEEDADVVFFSAAELGFISIYSPVTCQILRLQPLSTGQQPHGRTG